MTVTLTDTPSHYYSPKQTFLEDESEFVASLGNTNNTCSNTSFAMYKSSSSDTAPTDLMSDLNLDDDCSPTASLSSSSSSSSLSGPTLSNAITNSYRNANHAASTPVDCDEFIDGPVDCDEQDYIKTPFNQTPYIVQQQSRAQRLEPYVQGSPENPQSRRAMAQSRRDRHPSSQKHRGNYRRSSQRMPNVTSAAIPFEKTIPPTSFLRDELARDPGYLHALKAGTLWQSVVSQHVKFPALWYDGEEPARPYLGCEDPLKRNKWSYFGRHRVAGDLKLNTLVKNSRSSGKLILHIICKDSETLQPTEDIVVGVFHPNAEGIIEDKNAPVHCRDVWIGHRSRRVAHQGKRIATRIESLLRYLHKNTVDKSPLGEKIKGDRTRSSPKRSVDNSNVNAVFGSRAPRNTLFVPEEKLHQLLLMLPESKPPVPPASVLLLRTFLR